MTRLVKISGELIDLDQLAGGPNAPRVFACFADGQTVPVPPAPAAFSPEEVAEYRVKSQDERTRPAYLPDIRATPRRKS